MNQSYYANGIVKNIKLKDTLKITLKQTENIKLT
jgi:hypothetical protein